MARILIVYGTSEGHTKLIAQRIAGILGDAGHTVEMDDARDARRRVVSAGFDAVLVGGSVHAGEYQSSLRDFVRHNRQLLGQAPSAFFSVSLSAADPDDEAAAETKAVMDKFMRETGWQPKRVELIAGALAYTQYNFFIRPS